MKGLIVTLCFLLGACTFKVEMSPEGQQNLYKCKDLRDVGEFQFWGTQVKGIFVDYSLGYTSTCFKILDTERNYREFCSSSGRPDYIKCMTTKDK